MFRFAPHHLFIHGIGIKIGAVGNSKTFAGCRVDFPIPVILIIYAVFVNIYFPVVPISAPEDGKGNIVCLNLFPINGTLIRGYIDSPTYGAFNGVSKVVYIKPIHLCPGIGIVYGIGIRNQQLSVGITPAVGDLRLSFCLCIRLRLFSGGCLCLLRLLYFYSGNTTFAGFYGI